MSGQQFFFSSNLVERIVFYLLNALQDYFFLMCLHLHCGYCSNSSNMELQSLRML